MGGVCSTNWLEEKRIHVFGGKYCRKRSLERPRHRWEYMNWINMDQNMDKWQLL